MAFIPHSKDEIKAMLTAIGVNSVEDLFDEIPADLRSDGFHRDRIPAALNEMEAVREFSALAAKDEAGLCFIGAGAYEHHIPAAVWEIAGRGEFLTAYTPYQAEASQGTLQVIYEYQTMMASLMGLDISNASMYDGATALAEAILMALRANRKSKSKKVLIPNTLHPNYRNTIKTIVQNQGVNLIELPYCTELGAIPVGSLNRFNNEDIAALVIPQPNFFGALEDVDGLTDWAHQHGALAIACVNPLAVGLLKEPGNWGEAGVDIACGSGQPFGAPLSSGGPYFGFLCCKEKYLRQIPGRLVGRTVDRAGRTGFTLTLQAREQHIRRSKATSNICTNQGLLVTTATIYLSLMGPEGIKKIAAVSHTNTKKLIEKLTTIEGVSAIFSRPYFHEAVIRLPLSAERVIAALSKRGIQAGFSLSQYYSELDNCLLICATETKSEADLESYKRQLEEVLEEVLYGTRSVTSC